MGGLATPHCGNADESMKPSRNTAVQPNGRWQYDNLPVLGCGYHISVCGETTKTASRGKHLRDWRSGSAARLHRVGRQFESVIPYQFRRMWQAVMCCLHRMPRTSKPSYLILHFFLRDRLKVGQQVLILLIVVRIHVPQPKLWTGGRVVKSN